MIVDCIIIVFLYKHYYYMTGLSVTVQILPTAALSPEYPMEPEQYLLILLLEKNKMIFNKYNGTVPWAY